LDLSSTYERKHADFAFLNLTNFTYSVLQLHPFTFKPHDVNLPHDWIKLHFINIYIY
jgi:hypothetical protein